MAGKKGNRRSLLKRVLLPALIIAVVIAICVSLQLVYGHHPERLIQLKNHIYWGAFLISVIGNATVILPGAVLVILANIGIVLYPVTGVYGPVLVGVAGGAGAALGEMTGYMVGFSGRGLVGKSRLYHRLVGWIERWGVLIVFIFSIVPFFFDLVGIIAGALRLPLWKFVLFCWLGRSLMYVAVIVAASMGYQNILRFFS
jgi:membrane protein DedA with SNARE-associated domain